LDGVARKDSNAELQRRLNKDLYLALGNTSVSSVSEHDVRAAIRAVVNRSAHRHAISFFADLNQIFSGPESANLGGRYLLRVIRLNWSTSPH
jgi:hypothetical protein